MNHDTTLTLNLARIELHDDAGNVVQPDATITLPGWSMERIAGVYAKAEILRLHGVIVADARVRFATELAEAFELANIPGFESALSVLALQELMRPPAMPTPINLTVAMPEVMDVRIIEGLSPPVVNVVTPDHIVVDIASTPADGPKRTVVVARDGEGRITETVTESIEPTADEGAAS